MCEGVQLNSEIIRNNRNVEKFVGVNVIILSSRHLSKDEIYLLSKSLKFLYKAKIKEETEVYGRNLRLLWHFRNDQRSC